MWSWGKIAPDSISVVDNRCVNTVNGVSVVEEIPRESMAPESHVKSVLV
jgi:hypothetical protein